MEAPGGTTTRRPAAADSAPPVAGLTARILELQRQVGNQAVTSRLRHAIAPSRPFEPRCTTSQLMRDGDLDAGAGPQDASLPGGVATAPSPPPADAEAARVAKLNADYDAAVTAKDWPQVARLLNAYNADDIPKKLALLKPADIQALDAAAQGSYDRVHLFIVQPVMAAVHDLAGWKKLPPGDQSILDNMLGGATNKLSQSVRTALGAQLPTLQTQSEGDQTRALQAVITGGGALPYLVTDTVSTPQVEHTLSGPTARKGFAFDGKTADANEWVVKFKDGVSIPIVAPKAPTPGFHNHTVQETADALGALPKASRQLITRVLLNPVTNPQDPFWAGQYRTPNFHSYMTAGAAGVVTIYPDKASAPLPGASDMKGRVVHETGHTWAYKTWGEDKTKGKWLDWKKAMDKDRVSVSGYALADVAEDVSETLVAYVTTKGSPANDEYRKIVPNRFSMLDTEYR